LPPATEEKPEPRKIDYAKPRNRNRFRGRRDNRRAA